MEIFPVAYTRPVYIYRIRYRSMFVHHFVMRDHSRIKNSPSTVKIIKAAFHIFQRSLPFILLSLIHI